MVALWFNAFYSDGPWSYFGFLALIFVMAAGLEAIRQWSVSAYRKHVVSYEKHMLRKAGDRWKGRAIRAGIHTLHIFFGYLVMLAVMSYNVGIFLVALAGFGVGFLFFTDDHHPDPSTDCCDGALQADEEQQQLVSPTACH